MTVLTSTAAKTARACRRRYQHRYLDGLIPVQDSPALILGTAVHRGLEAWFRATLRTVKTDEWLDSALVAIGEPRELLPTELARARVMMTGYHLRWLEEQAALQVLAVEASFSGPLDVGDAAACIRLGFAPGEWTLAGKIDAIVRDQRTGAIRLVEHKTTSEGIHPGSPYWARLRMDAQISTYFDGAKLLGFEADDIIYDVLVKPAHKPGDVPVLDEHGMRIVLERDGTRAKTAAGKFRQLADPAQGHRLETRAETVDEFTERMAASVGAEPNRYYARNAIVRLEDELEAARADMVHLAASLDFDELLGHFPRTPEACYAYGSRCPYWEVCTGEASMLDERLYARAEDVHPELDGEAKP